MLAGALALPPTLIADIFLGNVFFRVSPAGACAAELLVVWVDAGFALELVAGRVDELEL